MTKGQRDKGTKTKTARDEIETTDGRTVRETKQKEGKETKKKPTTKNEERPGKMRKDQATQLRKRGWEWVGGDRNVFFGSRLR